MKKLSVLILIIGLLIANAASAAVAIDASSQGGQFSGAGPVTFNHTMSAAANGALFCSIEDTTGASSVVSGVTFNGTAMTLIPSSTYKTANRWQTSWYLLNPDSGTHSVSITLSASSLIAAVCGSVVGAKQSGFPDAGATLTSGSGTNINGSLTTVADNAFVIMELVGESTPFASTASTTIWIANASQDAGKMLSYVNNAVSPAGTITPVITQGNASWHTATWSIAPAVSSTNVSPVPQVIWWGDF